MYTQYNYMQLKLYEYDRLCLGDRLHLTWAVGTLLSSIESAERTYLLYAVYDYYVELVATHRNFETTITRAVAFTNGVRLDKYLEQIDLEPLLGN